MLKVFIEVPRYMKYDGCVNAAKYSQNSANNWEELK